MNKGKDEENSEDKVAANLPDEENPQDDMAVKLPKAHTPDKVLNILSAVQLVIFLIAMSIAVTNFFRENSTDDEWQKKMRLCLSIVEIIYACLGFAVLCVSVHDSKRPIFSPFSILKGLEFASSLVAAILMLSDLHENSIPSDSGFIVLCLSVFLSKLSDMVKIDKAYGGFFNEPQLVVRNSGRQAQAHFEDAGNSYSHSYFNFFCCSRGLTFHHYSSRDSSKDGDSTKWYSLALMTSLQEGSYSNPYGGARKGMIYINPETRAYCVLGEDRELKYGELPKNISLKNLRSRLEDIELKKQVLIHISRYGHAPIEDKELIKNEVQVSEQHRLIDSCSDESKPLVDKFGKR